MVRRFSTTEKGVNTRHAYALGLDQFQRNLSSRRRKCLIKLSEILYREGDIDRLTILDEVFTRGRFRNRYHVFVPQNG
jgi:hypothetical protein